MSNGVNLPQEIVADVLSRLSVKSLCRFNCVTYLWQALISDPNFAKTHLTRSKTNSDRVILISNSHAFYSVDYSRDLPVATKLDFPSVDHSDKCVQILGSCNGLLLAVNDENSNFLLNPSTRKSKKLPKSPFNLDLFDGYNQYGFGYDSSTDDYKVVMFSYLDYNLDVYDDEYLPTTDTNTIVSAYTLKTNSWRRIQDSPFLHAATELSSGVYASECLHWLSCRARPSDFSCVIAASDLAGENFREVPPPASIENDNLAFYNLSVLGGYLCLLVCESDIQTDVWMMKEYGVRESWTKFTVCEPQQKQIKFTVWVPNMTRIGLLGLLGDGEVLWKWTERNCFYTIRKKKH